MIRVLWYFSIVLEAAATCLGVESFRLSDALTQKFMKLRGEEITTPLTLEQVYFSFISNQNLIKNCCHFFIILSLLSFQMTYMYLKLFYLF